MPIIPNFNRASYFVLRHGQSRKVLDGSERKIYFDDDRDNDFHLWRFEPTEERYYFILRQKQSGHVLTAFEKDQVSLQKYDETGMQDYLRCKHWKLEEFGDGSSWRLVNRRHGCSLDGNGEKLYLYDSVSGNDHQRWIMEEKPDPLHRPTVPFFKEASYYVLRQKRSGKVLDGNERKIYFDDENTHSDFHLWGLEPAGDGCHHVVRQKQSRCVLTAGGDNKLSLVPYRHDTRQHWAVQGLDGDKCARLINCHYGQLALDGSRESLYLHTLADNDHQRWELKEFPDPQEAFLPADWMSGLADNLRLDQLTLPGTHDSGTALIATAVGRKFAMCQSEYIGEQLRTGIRFLDIRCRHVDNTLTIHHGPIYCEINFADVLRECVQFLASHPREIILLSVKSEHDTAGITDSVSFSDRVLAALRNAVPNWQPKPTTATLQDLRGQIQLFNRFDTNCGGFDATGISKDADNGVLDKTHLYAQDIYDMSKKSAEDKVAALKETFRLAATTTDQRLYVNFLSAARSSKTGAVFTSIEGYAEDFNREALDYLQSLGSGKKRLGVVPMDFPPAKLVYALIRTNF